MYKIWIAGSTQRTTQVADTIFQDNRFKISHIITPQPRKVGRKQEEVINPLHRFSKNNQISTTLVDKKIDNETKLKLLSLEKPDILIVVDFGFWVPKWLLDIPKKAPLNIHPSLLPRWRGSSPGQNVLLSDEKESAVTLMIMAKEMDAGPILKQVPFEVGPSWTQIEYYKHSFDLICKNLTDYLNEFMNEKLTETPQPKESPTPIAQKLDKKQSFREWGEIKKAMENGNNAKEIERACRAFYPWPKLWTVVSTQKGDKRLIIHQCSLDTNKALVLEKVQIEGKDISNWNEIKNIVS